MSVISAVHELGLGPAPRVHACQVRTTTPAGLPVECGRTPGHSGDHATSSLSHRWAQPLVGIVGDGQVTDIAVAAPNLSVVSS